MVTKLMDPKAGTAYVDAGICAKLLHAKDSHDELTDSQLLKIALKFVNESDAATSDDADASARRRELRECLGLFVDEPETLFLRITNEWINQLLEDVEVTSTWSFSQPRHGLNVLRFDKVSFKSWDGVKVYLVALLFKEGSKLEGILCRCQLETCKKFFLSRQSKKGGVPRRKFHSDECMLEAHARESAARVRKFRAKAKLAKGARRMK